MRRWAKQICMHTLKDIAKKSACLYGCIRKSADFFSLWYDPLIFKSNFDNYSLDLQYEIIRVLFLTLFSYVFGSVDSIFKTIFFIFLANARLFRFGRSQALKRPMLEEFFHVF